MTKARILTGALLVAILALSIPAVAADVKSPTSIQFESSPHAQIVQLKYFLKKWNGKQRLHFQVEIKNVSEMERRFRVRIALKEDDVVGMLFPQKVKGDGGIKAGGTYSAIIPTLNEEMPSNFSVFVEDF